MKWVDRTVWAVFAAVLIKVAIGLWGEYQVAEGAGVVFSDAFLDQLHGPARIMAPLALYLAVRHGTRAFGKR